MNVTDLKYRPREVDVVIHIDEQLDSMHRRHIESAVENQIGVSRARFNAERHHLMIVAYDPERIDSAGILNRVKHQKVNAQLIGGI